MIKVNGKLYSFIIYFKIRELKYFLNKIIYVEEFIGKTLKNYKILCYNGNPKYIYVSIKDGNNKYRNYYDTNLNFLNFSCMSKPHPT